MFFSYVVEGNSESNCVVRMTRFYFEKLGANYTGSVVPLCSARNAHAPSDKTLKYAGAIQDLQHVLGLIGENPQGNFLVLPQKIFLLPFL